MLRTLTLTIIIAFAASIVSIAEARTVCTVTLNSSDERAAFEKYRPEDTFVELSSRDPNWFAQACSSGVQCDTLLISGHFGGLFFGEKSLSTLSLSDMEHASCSNTCDGILKKPSEVFLMGCNTLATQTPDHRTIPQYINVLLNDGVPLAFAEQVVSSRYSHQGFSLEERFSSVFAPTTRLYGFASTGPLGIENARRFERSFSGVPLTKAFAGTNFRTSSGAVNAHDRALFCALKSSYPEAALNEIASNNLVTRFFDSLADLALNAPVAMAHASPAVAQTLTRLRQANRGLMTIQYEITKVQQLFGLAPELSAQAIVNQLPPRSYPLFSQQCEILQRENVRANKQGSFANLACNAAVATGGTFDWDFITHAGRELTAETCNRLASANPDDANADDMRWTCWDRNREHYVKNPNECFQLAQSMRVLGNKMKQVWNCSHIGVSQ